MERSFVEVGLNRLYLFNFQVLEVVLQLINGKEHFTVSRAAGAESNLIGIKSLKNECSPWLQPPGSSPMELLSNGSRHVRIEQTDNIIAIWFPLE